MVDIDLESELENFDIKESKSILVDEYIDILVDFVSENESFDNFMFVCDYLENLFNGEKVEVVTKNGLSPYIGPRILEEVIYA